MHLNVFFYTREIQRFAPQIFLHYIEKNNCLMFVEAIFHIIKKIFGRKSKFLSAGVLPSLVKWTYAKHNLSLLRDKQQQTLFCRSVLLVFFSKYVHALPTNFFAIKIYLQSSHLFGLTLTKISVCVSPIRYFPSETRIIGNWVGHWHSDTISRTCKEKVKNH